MLSTCKRDIIITQLQKDHQKSIEFHSKYVQNFNSPMNHADFQMLRLSYLNSITCEFGGYYQDFHAICLLINFLHLGFVVWNELGNEIYKNVDKEKMFSYFFFAACFLVIKLETPALLKKFKSDICEMGVDLETSHKMKTLIFSALRQEKEWVVEPSTFSEMNESVNTWVHFALNEYTIYYIYNELTITLACFLVVASYQNDVTMKKCLKQIICQIEMISIKQVEECGKNICDIFKSQISLQDNERDRVDSHSTLYSTSFEKDLEQSTMPHSFCIEHELTENNNNSTNRIAFLRKKRHKKVKSLKSFHGKEKLAKIEE